MRPPFIIKSETVYKSGVIPPHLVLGLCVEHPKLLVEFLKSESSILDDFLKSDEEKRAVLSNETAPMWIIFKDDDIAKTHPTLDNTSLQQFLCCDKTKEAFKEYRKARRRRLP